MMISSMITGTIIGLIAGALTSSTDRSGCSCNILLGLAGSWVGELLFDNWGPQLADMSIIPSILGAVLLIAIFDRSKKNH